jgi:hypothetical protein
VGATGKKKLVAKMKKPADNQDGADAVEDDVGTIQGKPFS